jgi:hypothetical protein
MILRSWSYGSDLATGSPVGSSRTEPTKWRRDRNRRKACRVTQPDFLPGVKVESGKLGSPESSAALAVNAFGWFIDRPELLPPLPGMDPAVPATAVNVEYCARFPWSGGRHPWLDAFVEAPGQILGIEAKRFEPFRDRKTVSLSPAYDRPVWGDSMGQYEQMRDRLRSGAELFRYLDAAQLVKHAFGLVTDGARKGKKPVLVYLYAEPAARNGQPIDPATFASHRREIHRFAEAVRGAAVAFESISYREWIASWARCALQVAEHGTAILKRFDP